MTELRRDWAVHPGELLLEELEERGLTQSGLAYMTGWSAKHVNRVIKGWVSMSAAFAVAVEEAVGVPAVVLVRMQAEYDVWQLRGWV